MRSGLIFVLIASFVLGDDDAGRQMCMADSTCENLTPPAATDHSPKDPSLDELKIQLVEARRRVFELEASIRKLEMGLPPTMRSSHSSPLNHMNRGQVRQPHPLIETLSRWTPDEEAVRLAREGGSIGWSSYFQPLSNPTLPSSSSSSSSSSHSPTFHYFNDPIEQWNAVTGKKGQMPSARRAGGKPFDLPGQILVGDAQGRVVVYSPLGSLVISYDTGSSSRVTAMTSYSLKRNESVLVTGHEDGEVRIHLVSEAYDGALREYLIASIAHFHTINPLPPPSSHDNETSSSEITHLAPYRLYNKKDGRRMFAAADAAGRIRLISDTDGAEKYLGDGGQGRLLAMQISGTVLVGLGERRAVVVNLLRPAPPNQLGQQNAVQRPRTLNCFEPHSLPNLIPKRNESSPDANEIQQEIDTRLVAVAFDPIRKFRAYGWTERGEITSFYIPHDTRPFSCKLSKMIQPFNSSSDHDHTYERGSVSLASLRGHLVLSLPSRLILFNVTSILQGLVQKVIVSSSSELLKISMESSNQSIDQKALVSVIGNSNLIAISSPGSDSFAFHASHLPIPRGMTGEPPTYGLRGMQQVVFMIIMIFVGLFQFFKARSRRLELGGTRGRRSFNPIDDEDDAGLEELEAKLGLKGGRRLGEDDEDDSEGDEELNRMRVMRGHGGGGGGGGGGGHGDLRMKSGFTSDGKRGARGALATRGKARDAAVRQVPVNRPSSGRYEGVTSVYDASRKSYGERVAQIERMRDGGEGGEEGGAFPVRSSMRAVRMGSTAEVQPASHPIDTPE